MGKLNKFLIYLLIIMNILTIGCCILGIVFEKSCPYWITLIWVLNASYCQYLLYEKER